MCAREGGKYGLPWREHRADEEAPNAEPPEQMDQKRECFSEDVTLLALISLARSNRVTLMEFSRAGVAAPRQMVKHGRKSTQTKKSGKQNPAIATFVHLGCHYFQANVLRRTQDDEFRRIAVSQVLVEASDQEDRSFVSQTVASA